MRVLWVLLIASCFQPRPQAGAPCTDGHTCPSGLTCRNDVCIEPGTGGDAGNDGSIIVDAPCGTCSADGTGFVPCTGQPFTCALGCSTAGGDHCRRIRPSNDVDPNATSMTDVVTLDATTTFDTNTGQITGGLSRPVGTGVIAGVGYYVKDNIAIFAFDELTVKTGELRFTGTRAVVLYAEGTLRVGSTIDISGGCYGADRSCPGPGGDCGSVMNAPATGTCAGGDGLRSLTNDDDGGGGGGGGSEQGGVGGTAVTAMAGGRGGACMDTSLIPLRGGGGGGGGGTGSSAFPVGGGGGGGIQLTSQTRIIIEGTLRAAGAGGDGGNTAGGSSASAGSGGGGGGGIMLEAPIVEIIGAVAANGGGGGGGGNSGVGPGTDGNDGSSSGSVAQGGAGTASPGPGNGGNGGAGSTAPTAGGDGKNSGGGGGGRGVIMIRAESVVGQGTRSPTAITGVLIFE